MNTLLLHKNSRLSINIISVFLVLALLRLLPFNFYTSMIVGHEVIIDNREGNAINFLLESLRIVCRQKRQQENCLHRTSNNAGDLTKSYSGTAANWARSPGPPPLFITLLGRYSSSTSILLLLHRGANLF